MLRVEEARATGATVFVTACPFCTMMREDVLRAQDIEEDELRVMDVAELVAEGLGH